MKGRAENLKAAKLAWKKYRVVQKIVSPYFSRMKLMAIVFKKKTVDGHFATSLTEGVERNLRVFSLLTRVNWIFTNRQLKSLRGS